MSRNDCPGAQAGIVSPMNGSYASNDRLSCHWSGGQIHMQQSASVHSFIKLDYDFSLSLSELS